MLILSGMLVMVEGEENFNEKKRDGNNLQRRRRHY